MAMSRKHYRDFADVIKDILENYPDGDANVAIREIAYGMCSVFKRDNSNFDRQKFLDAALKSDK